MRREFKNRNFWVMLGADALVVLFAYYFSYFLRFVMGDVGAFVALFRTPVPSPRLVPALPRGRGATPDK